MAYNSIFSGAEIDLAIRDGEWYNLRCLPAAPGNGKCGPERLIVIENFVPKLLGEQYRLVYMRQRRRGGRGLNWSIPLFGALRGSQGAWPLAATYLPVTGGSVPVRIDNACVIVQRPRNRYQLGLTRNTRQRSGYALFKNTGVGSFGWQRVSNIVGIEVFIGNKKTTTPADKIDRKVFTE